MNPAVSQNGSGPCVQRHQYPKEDVSYELQGGSKMIEELDFGTPTYRLSPGMTWYGRFMLVDDSNLPRFITF